MPLRNDSALLVDDQPEKSSYVKKADRGFAPDDFPLRPSRLELPQRVYQALRDTTERRVQTRVYASGIKDCARRTGFSLMGFRQEEVGLDHPEWGMTAAIGTAIHSLFEKLLPLTQLVEEIEYPIKSKDGSLSARVDYILKVPETMYLADVEPGEKFILDVKSMKKKDFEDGAWSWKMPGYYQQIQVYGYLTGVKTGVVLTVCRDDGRMQDYEFDIIPAVGAELLERASYIQQAALHRQVLPAEVYGTMACNLCPFRRQCDAEQGTGIVQWELDQGREPEEI